MPAARLPIGVSLGSIGVDAGWWLGSARRLDEAGYAGLWCWDHFVSKGRDRTTPVLEAWTMLAAAAATTRSATIGTWVANVMNRHPAVLARMAATLHQASGGRLVLGIGIGGHPAEHEAYGIPFPPAPERVARLEEAIAVIRALWAGGPVSLDARFYPLRDAHAFPAAAPPPPILVGARTPAGVELAARVADGWAAESDRFTDLEPRYREALERHGRSRSDVHVLVGFAGGRSGHDALAGSAWTAAPGDTLAEWRDRGADGIVLTARTAGDVDALITAAGRW